MATSRDVAIRLILDSGTFDKQLADAIKGGKGLDDALKDINKQLVGTGKALKDAGTTSEKYFNQREKAAKKLSDVERKAAKERSESTRAAVEDVIQAEKKLTEATKIEGQAATVSAEAVKAARADRIKAEIALEEAKKKKIEAILADELKVNKDNQEKILAAREKATKGILTVEKRRASLGQQLQKAEAAPKFEPLNRGFLEVGENVNTVVEGFQKFGNIGGLAATAFGPWGAAIGGAIDLLKPLFGSVQRATEAAKQLNAQYTILANTLNIDIGSRQFQDLRIEIQALTVPLGQTREDLVKLAQQAASFAPSDKLGETTKGLLDLQRIGGEDFNIQEAIAGVGRLSKAGIDSAKAIDILAVSGQSLKGKALDPMGEAVTEVGTVFSKAAAVIGDTDRALVESAAAFTQLTESGFEVSEATTAAEEIFLKLNDAVTDPKVLKAVTDNLPEGFNLIDVGLEKGNVSATKFIDAIQRTGEEGKQLAAALGSTAGEALQFLQGNFERTGRGIGDFVAQFSNVEGAASRTAALLTPVSQQLTALNEQRFDDFGTNFGQNFVELAGEGQSLFSALVDEFATADYSGLGSLGSAIDSVRDLFVESSVEAERMIQQLETVSGAEQAFAGIRDSLAPLTGESFIQATLANLDQIKNIAPASAAEIQKLASAEDAATPENIEKINMLLAQIADTAAVDSMLALNDALKASDEAVRDALSATDTWYNTALAVNDVFLEVFGLISRIVAAITSFGLTELLGMGEDVEAVFADATDVIESALPTFEERIQSTKETVADLNKEWQEQDALIKSGTLAGEELLAAEARRREIAVELNGARGEMVELQAQEQAQVEAVTREVENQAKSMALTTGAAIDLAAALEQVASANGLSADLVGKVQANLAGAATEATATAAATEQVAGAAAETDGLFASQKATMEAQAEQAGKLAEKEGERKSLLDEQTEAARALGAEFESQDSDKAAAIDAEIARNTALMEQLKAQVALIDAAITGEMGQAEALAEVAKIQENINQLKADQGKAEATGAVSVEAITATGGAGRGQLEQLREQLTSQISGLEGVNQKLTEAKNKLGQETQTRSQSERRTETARQQERRSINRSDKSRDQAADSEKKRQEDLGKALQKIREETTKFLTDSASEAQQILRNVYGEQLGDALQRTLDSQNAWVQGLSDGTEAMGKADDELARIDEELDNLEFTALDKTLKGLQSDWETTFKGLFELIQRTEQRQVGLNRTAFLSLGRAGKTALDLIGGASGNVDRLSAENAKKILDIVQSQAERLDVAVSAPALERLVEGGVTVDIGGVREVQAELDQIAKAFFAPQVSEYREVLKAEQEAANANALSDAKRTQLLKEQEAIQARLGRTTTAQQQALDVAAPVEAMINVLRTSEQAAGKIKEITASIIGLSELDELNQVTSIKQIELDLAGMNTTLGNARKRYDDFINAVLNKAGLESINAQTASAEQLADALTLLGASAADIGKFEETRQALLQLLPDVKASTNAIVENQQFLLGFEQQAAQTGEELQGFIERVNELTAASAETLGQQAAKFKDRSDLLQAELADTRRELSVLQQQAEEGIGDPEQIAALEKRIVELVATIEKLPDAQKELKLERMVATGNQIVDIVGTITNATATAVEGFAEMKRLFEEGATGGEIAGAGISAGLDLVEAAGRIMMTTPGAPPMVQLAGAILVAGAMVGKLVKQIVELFIKPERTALSIAQERNAVEGVTLALMQRRRALAERLNQLGILDLDQARERVKALREEIKGNGQRLTDGRLIRSLTDKQLATELKRLETQRATLETLRAQAEGALEGTREERKRVLLARGYTEEQLRGMNLTRKLNKEVGAMDAELLNINTDLENGNSMLDDRIALLEAQREIIEEQLALNELRVRLGENENRILNQNARIQRRALDAALGGIKGVGDTSKLTTAQLKELLRDLAKGTSELGPELQGLIDGWLGAEEALSEYHASSREGAAQAKLDLLEQRKRILGLKHELDELTDTEFREKMLKILNRQVDLAEKQGEELVAQGASEDEINENLIRRLELELEIKRLLEEQNGELGKEDKVLTDLIRKHQERIVALRTGIAGGEPVGDVRAELAATRTAMEKRLRDTGASEEEIQRFLASLPQFQAGGPTGEGGLALTHPGEYVLSADAVRAIGEHNLARLNELRLGSNVRIGAMDADRFLANSIANREASPLNINVLVTINQDNDFAAMSPTEANQALTANIQTAVEQAVNRGFTTGAVNGRR